MNPTIQLLLRDIGNGGAGTASSVNAAMIGAVVGLANGTACLVYHGVTGLPSPLYVLQTKAAVDALVAAALSGAVLTVS